MKIKKVRIMLLGLIGISLIIYYIYLNENNTSMSFHKAKNTEVEKLKNISTPWGVYPFKEIEEKGVPCLIKKGEYKAIRYITYPDVEGYVHATYIDNTKSNYNIIKSELLKRAKECGFKLNNTLENVFIRSLNYKIIKSEGFIFEKENENKKTRLIINTGVVKINNEYFTILDIDYQQEEEELKEID